MRVDEMCCAGITRRMRMCCVEMGVERILAKRETKKIGQGAERDKNKC